MKVINPERIYQWIISATFQLLLISSISHAQVIETESGKVEFMGLNEWTAPAVVDKQWLLNGTNFLAFPLVLKLLTEAGVSPALAKDLLRDDSHLIADHVHAEQPAIRDAARQFLVQLHGGREFESPSAMMKWMKSFRQN